MCGFVGVFKKDSSCIICNDIIELMIDAISHRGPDDRGFYVDKHVGLGHCRLAILDLSSAGHQPMHEHESRKVLVYNGEIYNFKDIRNRLQSTGDTFYTNCDTEVLLRLANVDNHSWIHEMLGMFAFAVWDGDKEKLMLCRDRLGIKPLYYINLPDSLIYASEIKALLRYPGVFPRINTNKIAEFISFRNISGEETLFHGIKELKPGHTLTISTRNTQPSITKYWSATLECENTSSLNSSINNFEYILDQSIKSRLISDVPLGTFNSGGIDSSLVSLFVKKHRTAPLHTFSVGFEESSYDESKYAELVAEKLNTFHHKLVIDETTYLNNFEKVVRLLEEPINHPHTIPLYLLCKDAKKYVTVVLTGEGADEVFGGYPRYQIALLSNITQVLPDLVRLTGQHLATKLNLRKPTKLLEICGSPVTASLECSRFTTLQDLSLVIKDDNVNWLGERRLIYEGHSNEKNFLERLLAYERDTYLQSLLVRLDKMSMACGLEARVPFLDHRLVCWSRLLSPKFKIKLFHKEKIIIKKCAAKYFPNSFVNRGKVGFGVPISEWLQNKNGLGGYLDLLLDDSFHRRYNFSRSALEQMVINHRNGSANHVEILWGLLSFELWCKSYIDTQPLTR